MENTAVRHEEISFKETIRTFWNNRFFITTFVLAGLVIGLIVSLIQIKQNPVTYRYQAKAILELKNQYGMTKQPQIYLAAIESKSLLEVASKKLDIDSKKYSVKTAYSYIPDNYNILVEGPDKEKITPLANEIISQVQDMALKSMDMNENRIVENAVVFGIPTTVSEPVNVILNLILSIMVAGMLSIFLIYAVRYMRGSVSSKNEAEKILKTKVLTDLNIRNKKNKLERFYRVS